MHFIPRIPYDQHLALLQRSDAHVYLTYPFVASWSLREAMACGCRIVASNTQPVREYLADRRTALLTPFFNPDALANRVLEVLEDRSLARSLADKAREKAGWDLDVNAHHMAFDEAVAALTSARLH